MRKALFGFLILMLPSSGFSQLPDSIYQKWLLIPEIKKGFDFALSAAKLTYQDFTLRSDYWEVDSCRLPAIDQLMASPLHLPSYSIGTAQYARELLSPSELLKLLANRLQGLDLTNNPLEMKNIAMNSNTKTHSGFAKLNKTYPSMERILNDLYGKMETLQMGVLFPYNANERDFIQKLVSRIVLENTEEEGLSVDAQDSVQELEDELTRRFVPLAGKFNPEQMNENFVEFVVAAEKALNTLKGLPHTAAINYAPIILDTKTPLGRVVVGGYGPNHYKEDYALIIDLGGDDTYELPRRPSFENQIIIDLGGNDKYFALEDYALACGYIGYSVLIDVAGDDLYQGKNFSLGCGFFGCGLLWDQAGSDTYIGDQFTQGAGGFGIGILKDDGGDDRYSAAYMAQGFGSVRGVGALLDATGNDNYFAGGKYIEGIGLSDEIRHLSMAQGCALGLRPYLSGGMGFLFDYEGDDSYSVDMNGQGSSYWWGLGVLVDFKGNDRYVAQQYAQGAGVHMSLGVLVDSSGNDFYYSKGVAQGAGHDWGAGMLFDLYGNDTYVATDGSQAFGNSNGIGILADGSGDDGYYVKNPKKAQVYGDARREYGSIAVMLDCGGTDHYDGNGGENRIWKPTGTTWGVGVDWNFGPADSTQVKK